MAEIDVFISYKREERSLAEAVSRALVAKGYVAVTDLNIQKAVDFGEAIDSMIREARLVVVLWTEAAASSRWVRKEAEEADRLNKYFGVRVGEITADDLPLAVRTSNWLDVSGQAPDALAGSVSAEVQRLIGQPRQNSEAAGKSQQIAQGDMEFFQVAESIGEAQAYKRYLEVYPDGTFSDVAKSRVKKLNRWYRPLLGLPVLAIVGTAAAAFGAYASYVGMQPPVPADAAELAELRDDLSEARRTAQIAEREVARLQEQLQNADPANAEELDALGQRLNDALAAAAKAERELQEQAASYTSQIDSLRRQLAALSQRDSSSGSGSTDAVTQILGMQIIERNGQLVVAAVDRSGVAAEKGISRGDVILEADQKVVATGRELAAQQELARRRGAQSVLLLVRSSDEVRFIALPIS